MKEYHAVVDKDGELLLCDSRREAQQVSRQLHDEQGAASSHRAVVLVERQDWMAVPQVVRGAVEDYCLRMQSQLYMGPELDWKRRAYVGCRAWLASVTTEVRDAA